MGTQETDTHAQQKPESPQENSKEKKLGLRAPAEAVGELAQDSSPLSHPQRSFQACGPRFPLTRINSVLITYLGIYVYLIVGRLVFGFDFLNGL